MNKKLFEFIKKSPTAYHATASASEMLRGAGFVELYERDMWILEKGKCYFTKRNESSIIAFKLPCGEPNGFMMTSAHTDSPCFKVKENGELCDQNYTRLSTETYGGMILSSWFDRPLSVAGRVMVRTKNGIEGRLIDSGSPCAIIPNVAIHMNREINNGFKYNASIDVLPLFSADGEKKSFKKLISELSRAEESDIMATDIFVYNPQNGQEWGKYISSPRLDDLQCAFATLTAFIRSQGGEEVALCALFDNEEVGSTTKQGAASTFLSDVVDRIVAFSGGGSEKRAQMLANSFMLSCDNAHAVHPNHPEYADKNHTVKMNGGIVIKYNANQKYTSDAVSAALFKLICEKSGTPTQIYANRADMPGGSTLGNISTTQVSLNTVDIGLAQLAMHSSYETAGKDDTAYMVNALTDFFSSSVKMNEKGYELR